MKDMGVKSADKKEAAMYQFDSMVVDTRRVTVTLNNTWAPLEEQSIELSAP